jgi:hypothetical protein
MKQNNYEDVTISDIQTLYKTGYITEITFDADSKTISLKNDECLAIKEVFDKLINAVQKVAEAVCEVGKKMAESLSLIFQNLSNKKLTKKKFIKLLQSEGIQRNTINEIVKGNKESYTYMRYYRTLQNLKR